MCTEVVSSENTGIGSDCRRLIGGTFLSITILRMHSAWDMVASITGWSSGLDESWNASLQNEAGDMTARSFAL